MLRRCGRKEHNWMRSRNTIEKDMKSITKSDSNNSIITMIVHGTLYTPQIFKVSIHLSTSVIKATLPILTQKTYIALQE